MMKLLLAVIATCALVVSPTCIKIKHQLRSNAPTIHVLISNGNTQMTSQVGRNGSHRFITDNLSSMTLAPAGSQTITLSYDEIFPITNATVCTEVHPVSAGGCADGVCCKVSISMYTITDAIIMTARVNNRNADGNPQFWKCEQEIQVPGVTNTEPTGEELAAEILRGELGDACSADGDCKDASGVYVHGYRCEDSQCTNYCDSTADCGGGYICNVNVCEECDQYGTDDQCHDNNYDINTECKQETGTCQGGCPFLCSCKTDYYGDGTVCADEDHACVDTDTDTDTDTDHCISADDQTWGACTSGYATVGEGTTCIDFNECEADDDDDDRHKCDTDTGATCDNDCDHDCDNDCDNNCPGSYSCDCNSDPDSEYSYYGDGFITSATNPNTQQYGTGCTACDTCDSNEYCSDPATSTATSTCCKTGGCKVCETCVSGPPAMATYCSLYADSPTNACCEEDKCAAKKNGGETCTDNEGNPVNEQCKSYSPSTLSDPCRRFCVATSKFGETCQYLCICDDNTHCSSDKWCNTAAVGGGKCEED